MLVITRHRTPIDGFPTLDAAVEQAREVLALFAARPGFIRGWVARAVDDAAVLVLAHEWTDVGSYRRALGSYEIKLHAVFLQSAADEASAFEILTERSPDAFTDHVTAIADNHEGIDDRL
jgi:hypothetical protein